MADAGSAHWSDWITAASTAATALFAAMTGWVGLLAYRQANRRLLPVVEPTLTWQEDSELGRFIYARLHLTNRLDETIIVERIRAVRPRRSLLSAGQRVTTPDARRILKPTKGMGRSIFCSEQIASAGSEMEFVPGHTARFDIQVLEFYIFPRRRWSKGVVRLQLRVSSKALTIRDKRMIVQSKIPPMPIKSTAVIASSSA